MYYDKKDYIETDTGNKVSRKAFICGSSNIVIGGKTIIMHQVMLRGDLRRAGSGHAVVLSVGRYTTIADGCVVRPPYKTYKGVFSYYPQKIGDYVHVGSNTIIEAASIGNNVKIGKNCVIGRFAIIKDCAEILDDTIIAPGTVIPSMSVFAGSPGQRIRDLPESSPETMEAYARAEYADFKAAPQ